MLQFMGGKELDMSVLLNNNKDSRESSQEVKNDVKRW